MPNDERERPRPLPGPLLAALLVELPQSLQRSLRVCLVQQAVYPEPSLTDVDGVCDGCGLFVARTWFLRSRLFDEEAALEQVELQDQLVTGQPHA